MLPSLLAPAAACCTRAGGERPRPSPSPTFRWPPLVPPVLLQLLTADQVEFWHHPEKAGWMHSQGEHIRTWRKRWFVLKQVWRGGQAVPALVLAVSVCAGRICGGKACRQLCYWYHVRARLVAWPTRRPILLPPAPAQPSPSLAPANRHAHQAGLPLPLRLQRRQPCLQAARHCRPVNRHRCGRRRGSHGAPALHQALHRHGPHLLPV